MSGEPDVSAIVVNWNTADLLERALRSLLAEQEVEGGPSLELVVVDNGSSDGSPEMIRSSFPAVRLIANPDNRGFAAAVNQGIRVARGRFLLLLNSDARLGGGSLAALTAYLEQHPAVAIVGPKLLHPDGSVQSSRRRFPTFGTALLESTPLQRVWPAHPLLRRYYVLDRSDEETQSVDWLVGACLLARRAAVDQVGPLDERFFMYSEEMDWCRRFKAAGWDVVYHPRAAVVHEYGKSSERDVAARHIHFNESKCRYFGKYHGRAAEVALRAYLLAGFLYLSAEECLKLLLGHKPALRRRRLREYARVIAYQTHRLPGRGA